MQRFIFILLLSLSAIQCGVFAESNLRSSSVSNQRRELGPPHPHHHSSSSSSNGNNNNNDGGSGGEMSSQSGSDETTASVQSQYAETTDGVSSSSGGSSGYGVFEDVAKYFSNGGDSANGSAAGISIDSTSAANVFMFAAAALVAGLVGAALVVMRKVSIETDSICISYLSKTSYLTYILFSSYLCYSNKQKRNQTDAAEPLSVESGFNEVTSVPHGSMGTVSIRSASYTAPVVA